ncbi:hypothetical protein EB796_007958 [Bugula neritina]|uniref:Uncharacterized protein n=1 Tax=Bugula neritina TaxID=10212 RepID=A0A7J7K522_BUGNE|nr:hypothetical protein EB796_007958 [Bugula neritina]
MASSRKDGHVVSKEELDSFKRDYYSAPGGPYNLAVQIPHLSKLADGYIDEYERTGHWTDALKQEFPNDLSKTWRCVKALTYSLAQRRHEKITLQYNESFLAKFENSNQSPSDETQQFLLADIYSEIGASHYGLSKYATAQEYFRRAIRIWKTLNLLGEDSIVMVAKMQLKLGECFLMMFKYEKSLKHLLKAMQICIDESLQQTAKPTPTVNIFLESPESRLVFITTPTVILAHVIWTIGIVYQYTKYYQRAALYFQKSLEMFLELYGEESCHRDIANTLYHLGVAIESVKRGIPFSDFYLESMIMTTQLYCNDHLHLTLVLEKADLSGTKEFYDICLNVFPQLSRFGVAHSQSATVVSRFGYHLTFAGLPGRASQAFDIALNMFENPCSEDEYSYVYKAQTIAGQAFNDWKNGDGLLAEQLFAEAFRIFESTNPTDSLLDQAEILVNKGDMYLAFAEKSDVRAKSSSFQQQALKCYQLALCKQKLGSCDFTHPQLTEINQKIEKLLSEVL